MGKIGKMFNWRQWLLLYCAFSFALLGVDAAMNHHSVLTENMLSYTPLLFAPLALLYSVIAIFRESFRRKAWGMGIAALLVGGAGTLIHNYYNIVERSGPSIWGALLNAQFPVFAPAAFASTGLLLFLVAWGECRQELGTQP